MPIVVMPDPRLAGARNGLVSQAFLRRPAMSPDRRRATGGQCAPHSGAGVAVEDHFHD